MDSDALGLWLTGVGALLVALQQGPLGPRPDVLRVRDPMSTVAERLNFAAGAVGALLVAAGGVLLLAGNLPALWVVAATVAVVAAAGSLLSSVQLRALWTARLGPAEARLANDQTNRRAVWDVDCARLCATWRFSLAHPFAADDSARRIAGRRLGPAPEPRHAVDDVVLDSMLARHEDHIARLDDAAIPRWLRDVVLAVRAQGGEVLRTATALVFYAPDRTVNLSWDSEPPIAAARHLARRMLVTRLERELGFTFTTTQHGSVIARPPAGTDQAAGAA